MHAVRHEKVVCLWMVQLCKRGRELQHQGNAGISSCCRTARRKDFGTGLVAHAHLPERGGAHESVRERGRLLQRRERCQWGRADCEAALEKRVHVTAQMRPGVPAAAPRDGDVAKGSARASEQVKPAAHRVLAATPLHGLRGRLRPCARGTAQLTRPCAIRFLHRRLTMARASFLVVRRCRAVPANSAWPCACGGPWLRGPQRAL